MTELYEPINDVVLIDHEPKGWRIRSNKYPEYQQFIPDNGKKNEAEQAASYTVEYYNDTNYPDSLPNYIQLLNNLEKLGVKRKVGIKDGKACISFESHQTGECLELHPECSIPKLMHQVKNLYAREQDVFLERSELDTLGGMGFGCVREPGLIKFSRFQPLKTVIVPLHGSEGYIAKKDWDAIDTLIAEKIAPSPVSEITEKPATASTKINPHFASLNALVDIAEAVVGKETHLPSPVVESKSRKPTYKTYKSFSDVLHATVTKLQKENILGLHPYKDLFETVRHHEVFPDYELTAGRVKKYFQGKELPNDREIYGLVDMLIDQNQTNMLPVERTSSAKILIEAYQKSIRANKFLKNSPNDENYQEDALAFANYLKDAIGKKVSFNELAKEWQKHTIAIALPDEIIPFEKDRNLKKYIQNTKESQILDADYLRHLATSKRTPLPSLGLANALKEVLMEYNGLNENMAMEFDRTFLSSNRNISHSFTTQHGKHLTDYPSVSQAGR